MQAHTLTLNVFMISVVKSKFVVLKYYIFTFVALSVSLPFVCDSLSELETDIKVFKESLLKILDEDEIIEELCLTKWTDPRVLYVTLALRHAYINECKKHLLTNSCKVLVSGLSRYCRTRCLLFNSKGVKSVSIQ